MASLQRMGAGPAAAIGGALFFLLGAAAGAEDAGNYPNKPVLGGHVDLMFTTISSAMELVRDKKVKALAVTTRERMADLPDIPTMYELGWTNLVTSSWQGVLVPSGTPRPIVEKLRAAIAKVLADPQIQARMLRSGAIAVASKSPEAFKAYMDAETAKWSKVIEDNGLHPD